LDILIDVEDKLSLELIAAKNLITVSEVVRRMIRDYLNRLYGDRKIE